MSYQFPPDLEKRVKAQISGGDFSSEDDVLRRAMDALEQLEEEKLTRWHNGNQVAIEQSCQGLSRPLNQQAILERLKSRLACEGILE